MADAFDRTDRLATQVFPIQIGDKHFNVRAKSEEEAYAKAQAFLEQQGVAPQADPATAPQEPREEKGPPAPTDVPEMSPELAALPSVNEAGTGFDAEGRPIQPQVEDQAADNPIWASLKRFGNMVYDQALRTSNAVAATPEIGATMATGAAAEVVGGLSGLAVAGAAAVSDNVTADHAANTVNWISDALTFEPKSQNARGILQNSAAPLVAIDNGIDHIATVAATDREGNFHPGVATFVKTTLYGAPELLGLKGFRDISRAGRQLKQTAKQVEKEANKLGINMTHKNMAEDILEAASVMGPNTRGAHASELQDALHAAYKADKDNLNATFEAARAGNARLYVANIEEVAPAMRQNVLDQFDLAGDAPGMDSVRRALDDLQNVRAVNPRTRVENPNQNFLLQDYRDIESIRRRLNQVTGQGEGAGAAAFLKHQIDDFLLDQMNRGLIRGTPDDIKLWTKAREANVQFQRRYSDDRIIKNLLDQNATPEQIHAWLLGSSAVSSAKQSSQVLRRLKNVLGEDSPAIRGIRQDFLYDIVQPLMEATEATRTTALRQFVRNYDRTVRRNPSLVRELGLNEKTDLKPLRDFAEVASRLPENKRLVSASDISTYLSRFLLGHEIAKATIKVNLGRNIVNMMIGADRVSRKQIMGLTVGAMFGKPVKLGPGGMTAYSQLAGSLAVESLKDTTEEMKRDSGQTNAENAYKLARRIGGLN